MCETMTKCNTMENTGLINLLSHKDHLDHIFWWCKPALTSLASLERCQTTPLKNFGPLFPCTTPHACCHTSAPIAHGCAVVSEAVLHTFWPLEREIPYSFPKFSEKPLGKLKATQAGDMKSFLDFDPFLQGFSCLQQDVIIPLLLHLQLSEKHWYKHRTVVRQALH